MRLRHPDLLAALVSLCLAIVVIQFAGQWLIPRLLLTMLLVFYLPGYTLLCAVSPAHEWDWVDTPVISIGLSLAIGVIGSLVLHALRFGLYQNTWLGMYLLQSGLCIALALWRRHPLDEQPIVIKNMIKPRLLPMIPVGLGLVVLTGAWIFGSNAQIIQNKQAFTQLWMTPCQTDECDAEIGMYNFEWQPEEYRLVIIANGMSFEEWDSISLDHDKTWTAQVDLPSDAPNNSSLLARLYLKKDPDTVYRSVILRRLSSEK